MSRPHHARMALAGAIALSLLAMAAEAPLIAQANPPAQRFRSGVEVVEVAILARDSSGRPVTDLTRADVTVVEQGVPQAIVGFERVSLPVFRPEAAPPPERTVRDVSSNESIAESRVFVLVLDALHVAADRNRLVRDYARQFIDRVVGPRDLSAVFSPGAVPAATADFTSDKSRLIAAIESFTGTKLRSATVEREEDKRRFMDGVPMYGGKDPSDGERANRAYALTGTLQALAGHLDRIEGRRKVLLLFSEGIDYDTSDVMGTAQRYASEVNHAIDRAIGALQRTNVAVYTIDPRGLGSAQGDLIQTPIYERSPGSPEGFSERGVEAEANASMRSLRFLAESTGGFFASDRGIPRAFDQIAQDSSEYYIVRYAPARPAKPGESRSISVRSSRPDVRLVARKGYVVPRAETARAAAIDPGTDPAQPPMAGGPRGRPGVFGSPAAPIPTASPRPAAGVEAGLAALLASPLPKAGLPLRVQAVPFGADSRRRAVQLIVEVLGEGLRFATDGGRSKERIDLAMLTVDERGRGANGKSTRIDLSLPPADVARVRATGVRWLSRIDLQPGRYQLRVAASAAETGTTGMITLEFDVPKIETGRIGMSGITLTSLPAVLMITRGDGWLEKTLKTPPSAARRFVGGDRITAGVQVPVPGRVREDLEVTAAIEDAAGAAVLTLASTVPSGAGRDRLEEVAFEVDTSRLEAGSYVLRIAVKERGVEQAMRTVPFEVLAGKPR